MIKDRLNDLKEETNYMSKEEKELQNIDKLIDIVEEILKFKEKKPTWRRSKNFNTKPNA